MSPPSPARKPFPSFFSLIYANSCKSAVPTVYYAIFAFYEPFLCIAGMIGTLVDPVKVCILHRSPLRGPTDHISIDALNCTPDSQHEWSLAGRCRAARNFARSHDCQHTPVGPHMCSARHHQFLCSHCGQGSTVSRIAREDRHGPAYPLSRDRRLAHLSDALRYRRHEVERQ